MSIAHVDRFQRFVEESRAQGRVVMQPRMGVSDLTEMRTGLLAVRDCMAPTVGTITVDSYTRVNDHNSARKAIDTRVPLNGFPLVAHGVENVRAMLRDVADADFPIQVRHGSARPYELFETLIDAGVDATEGGPVSYCLPYSRLPLRDAAREWARSCELAATSGRTLHLETFGGCMLGQLCPPGLLVALSVLEALFFVQHGLRSVSVSYAQQTNLAQDIAAVHALRRLASELLPSEIAWHTVVYTYMGVYPLTELGAFHLLEDSVRLAAAGKADRLIVKTPAEAHQIPSFEENVSALEFAAAIDSYTDPDEEPFEDPQPIYEEARRLIESTVELSRNIGDALVRAFAIGRLDVPYCLHSDNANQSRAAIDSTGRLVWVVPGNLAVRVEHAAADPVAAAHLLEMLNHNRHICDRSALIGMRREMFP